MQSHITFQLTKGQTIESKPNDFLPLSIKPLRMAKIKEVVLDEGHIIVQSISHYLAYIELFEYALTAKTSINFTVNISSFFLYADVQTGLAQLCYLPKGKYRKVVRSGTNQVMLLTLRPDWLIYKCKQLPHLMSFNIFFCDCEDQPMNLPSIGIANKLIRSLIKMDASVNDLNMDNDGYIFINGCINKYHNKLQHKNDTARYYHDKAAAISSFIKTHFATEEAENLPKLANRFMVSERTLARLTKIAFGIPLHEQVIKLRIHYALNLLLTTSKPIFEIATLSGYREPYYFSRAFKKYFGVCPKSINRPSKKIVEFELQS